MKQIIRNLIYKNMNALHQFLFKNQFKEIIELISPSIISEDKATLGRQGDGTYIIPETLIKSLNNPSLISFGIADDISFELEYIAKFRGAKVFCFDPSIDQLPEGNKMMYFKSLGLAGKTNKNKKLFSLEDILAILKLEITDPLILKMDIEGWEWGFLERKSLDKLNIPVIALELHFLEGMFFPKIFFIPYYFKKRINALKHLFKHYHIYHVHANNNKYLKFKNFIFPCLLELTLIKKDIYTKMIISDISNYNIPNNNLLTDYQFPFLE